MFHLLQPYTARVCLAHTGRASVSDEECPSDPLASFPNAGSQTVVWVPLLVLEAPPSGVTNNSGNLCGGLKQLKLLKNICQIIHA